MKSVAHVSIRHAPFDTRIFQKECKTLSKYGYDVSFIVPHTSDDIVDSVKIISLKKTNSKFYKVFKNIPDALSKCSEMKSDIYHFHDPELIPVGILLKLRRKSVVYDAHEDHPKDVFEKKWPLILKIIASIYFTILEKLASLFFDRIVSATPHINEKYPKNKSVLLRNVPVLDLIDKTNKIRTKTKTPIVIYQGGITELRGITQIIEAIGNTKEKSELWLFGKWEEGFEAKCSKLKGWGKTKYMGIVPQKELYGYGKFATIGIINYLPSPNNNDSLPNKPFEYMACSLPMVMSDFPHWKEMFNECALFANPEDPKDISEKMALLLNDKELRTKLGKMGRALVEEEYNWEKESRKLIELYKEL